MTRKQRIRMLALGLVALLGLSTSSIETTLLAQADLPALRAQIESRFEVLPLQDGVVLRPRGRTGNVRSIEIHEGSIAVDGQVVSGAELRSRLGNEADLVIRVSYLTPPDLRTLTGAVAPVAAPAAGGAPGGAAQAPAAAAEPAGDDDRGSGDARDGRRRARERARDRVRDALSGRRGDRSGDRVRFGGSVTVAEDETVDGDVVVFGGAAHVMGRVDGDVVVIGGSADLGPKADVSKDLVVIGGRLNRDPASRVGGDVQEIGVGPFSVPGGISRPQFRTWNWGWMNPFTGMSSLFMTAVRTGVLCLLAVVVVLLGGSYVDRIRALASAEPLKVGAVGFLSQVLAVPAMVVITIVLAITIIGIPFLLLMPFALLALAILALVGFTAVARQLGELVLGRFGERGLGEYAATLAGVLAILSPLLLARVIGIGGGPLWLVSTPLAVVGFCAEYAAWTVGFGAVLFALFGGRPPVTPPPLPQ
jgi:formylmethanofuran dehydrogenase subunit C